MRNSRSITILLAVYNGEKYLKIQIDSLLAQINTEWTLYIRNDGSSDGTQVIIEQYVCQYPDKIIQVDKGGENLGCKDNFLRLLQLVESPYYMFCDVDDLWLAQKIDMSYKMLREKEELYPDKPLMVHTDKIVTDSELNIVHQSAWCSAHFNSDLFLEFKYIPKCIVGGASAIFNHKVKELASHLPHFQKPLTMAGWLL